MALFTFRRVDTNQEVSFTADGRKGALNRAAVKLGLTADQIHLIKFVRKEKKEKKLRKGKKPR